MEKRDVTMVRIYLTEGRAKVGPLLRRLARSGKFRGITVFEAAAGFGTTAVATSSMTSVEGMPVILEFFDEPARIKELVDLVRSLVAPRHVVVFPVSVLETRDVPVMMTKTDA